MASLEEEVGGYQNHQSGDVRENETLERQAQLRWERCFLTSHLRRALGADLVAVPGQAARHQGQDGLHTRGVVASSGSIEQSHFPLGCGLVSVYAER